MITNRDIELAFARAQNRINERLNEAQTQFMLPDMERLADVLIPLLTKGKPKQTGNKSNPIANEEI